MSHCRTIPRLWPPALNFHGNNAALTGVRCAVLAGHNGLEYSNWGALDSSLLSSTVKLTRAWNVRTHRIVAPVVCCDPN